MKRRLTDEEMASLADNITSGAESIFEAMDHLLPEDFTRLDHFLFERKK